MKLVFDLLIKPLVKKFVFLLILTASIGAQAEIRLLRANGRLYITGSAQEVHSEITYLQSYKIRVDGGDPTLPQIIKGKADITDLIPQKMLALDTKQWLDNTGGFGNCHGEANYFLGLSPILSHDESGNTLELARRAEHYFEGAPKVCADVEYSQVQGGDVGVILDPSQDGLNLHSFTLISKNLVFSKNGHNGLGIPYQVYTLTELADIYFSFTSADESKKPSLNYYRDGLKKGFDCVRGTTDVKRRNCVDSEYPIVYFSRCKPIAQFETENRAVLTKEYFDTKAIIWNELKSFTLNQAGVLIAPTFSARYKAAVAKVIQKETRYANQAAPPKSAIFWSLLGSVTMTADEFFNPKNEVRKAIFP